MEQMDFGDQEYFSLEIISSADSFGLSILEARFSVCFTMTTCSYFVRMLCSCGLGILVYLRFGFYLVHLLQIFSLRWYGIRWGSQISNLWLVALIDVVRLWFARNQCIHSDFVISISYAKLLVLGVIRDTNNNQAITMEYS